MNVEESRTNPSLAVERWRSLRKDRGVAVLEGLHALKHGLRFGAEVTEAWCADVAGTLALAADLCPDLLGRLPSLLRPVSAEALEGAGGGGLRTPVLALARRPVINPAPLLAPGSAGHGFAVLLERPTHAGNAGAAVRVAAAAGAHALLTTGPLDPWHPTALRGSAGLHFALPVAALPDGWASRRPLVAFDAGGEAFRPRCVPPGAILAFGSERTGLSEGLKARADRVLSLPMRPGVSSLNLATAVAAALYSLALAR